MARTPAVYPALIISSILAFSSLNTVNAGCILERSVTTAPDGHDAYTCFRSNDFHKDIEKLPLDNTKLINISFKECKVSKIEENDLKKIGTKALGISIVHCGIHDIDENAFRGLTELKALILRRNNLDEVKKGWFTDLDKLESLDLSGNQIREFDSAIFDLIPMIQEFEISENQLTRFDVDAMKTKWPKLKKIGLQWNPYEWSQGVKIIEYSNKHPSIVKNSYVSIDGIRDTTIIVKECQNSITKKDDPQELDDCVRSKLNKSIDFPKILEGEKAMESTTTTAAMTTTKAP